VFKAPKTHGFTWCIWFMAFKVDLVSRFVL